MKIILFTLSCYLVSLEALKCEIGQKSGDKIKQALKTCVKNNETLEKILEMSVVSNEENSSEEDESQTMPTNKKSGKNSRNKRATMKDRSISADKSKNSKPETEKENNTVSEESSSETDISENCVIHCVLEHMELVDSEGLPDHSKIVDGLLRDVKERELRSFLQDTVDECYQDLKEGDKCTFSNKLMKCLAEKGRSNCADWPAGALPF